MGMELSCEEQEEQEQEEQDKCTSCDKGNSGHATTAHNEHVQKAALPTIALTMACCGVRAYHIHLSLAKSATPS
jgi:hypothetical protein